MDNFSFNELKQLCVMLGYDGPTDDCWGRIHRHKFLEQQGFVITKGKVGWDLNFKSPQAELMFSIKYSDLYENGNSNP